MYHPTRGGVRGGRDQFSWDDVKVDKHRENYLGHSVKAPVGRWQKGKDLNWYAKDKKSKAADDAAMKEEIKRIKEQEEQAMREALGLAPKQAARPKGTQLDKYEYAELIKRGSTAEDLGAGHAEAAQVQGLGLYKGHRAWADSSVEPEEAAVAAVAEDAGVEEAAAVNVVAVSAPSPEKPSEDKESKKRRRKEERRQEKEKKREKRSSDPDRKRNHGRDDHKRRH